MLLFILALSTLFLFFSKISKHLMLLFILIQLRDCLNEAIFQNISCCYLSTAKSKESILIDISKHLMLLFIDLRLVFPFCIPLFQNISCCYLSIMDKQLSSQVVISKHLMLLFIQRILALFNFSPSLFPLYFQYFSIFYQPSTFSNSFHLIFP